MPTFELLALSERALAQSLHTEVAQAGGILTSVSPADWVRTTRDRVLGSTRLSEWVVFAEDSGVLEAADFANLAKLLCTVQADLWLQPWNVRCQPALKIWQACGPRVAACWNNPASTLAVCVNLKRFKHIESADELLTDDASIELSWQLLFQQVMQGAIVSHGLAEPASAFYNYWGELHLRLPNLVPTGATSGSDWLRTRVLSLRPSQIIPDKRSDADAVAIKAGICQWHDWLDESHQLAQSIEGLGRQRAGDYWHAVMHRREPDYSNAKYWFRQLGSHPVYKQLAPFVDSAFPGTTCDQIWRHRLGKGGWDPLAFVDFCEACAEDENKPLALIARILQATEMQLLLEATYRDAL